MQPLPVMAFQEESAPAFAAPVPDSNPPQTRDPEEDLLCIAKTFSYLRESGKAQVTRSRGQKATGSRESTLQSELQEESPDPTSDRDLVLSQPWLTLVDAASVFSVSTNLYHEVIYY